MSTSAHADSVKTSNEDALPSQSPAVPTMNPRSSGSFSSGRRSPSITEFDSSAALVLVPEHEDDEDDDLDFHPEIEDQEATPFEFFSSSDDSSDDSQDELLSGRSPTSPTYLGSSSPALSVPPLSSIAVFLYLLSPLLKLGALLSSSVGIDEFPLRISLPALFFFANLCAFTRQIWYMLARYVRRPDIEEIVLQTFARGVGRGREGERKRRWVQLIVRCGMGIARVLLVTIYLRASTDVCLPLLPSTVLKIIPTRLATTVVLALFVAPLCFTPATASLGSATVLYASWISVATYIAWVAGTAYAHAKGMYIPTTQGDATPGEGSLGALWQGISIIAFAYSTSSTVPLYAALRSTGPYCDPSGSPKTRRGRSFKLLSLISITLATLLVLPPTIFRLTQSSPDPDPASQPLFTPAPFGFKCLMAFLSAMTLILGIPSTVVTAPAIPVPHIIRRHINHLTVSRLALFLLSLLLALLPSTITRITSNLLLLLAFLSTFTVPAFIHIVIHNFRRPLAIVMPPSTPGVSLSHSDELLQRKERTLQRRRFARRLLWDVGVWVLLLPVGGGSMAWAAGRLAGRW